MSKNGVLLTELQVARSIDKLSINSFMKYMLVVAAAGFLFDSFDTSLVAYIMPSIAKEFNLSPVIIGLVASAAVWGTVLGQYVWGPLADKLGRRFAFQGTVLSFGLLTGLAAFAWNSVSLWWARFMAGTGLGGFIPLDAVMIMEMAPTKVRGRMVSFLPVFFPAGQLLAAGTTLALLPLLGWRGMFLVGALPAILAWWARRVIPETPRWLVAQGRHDEAKQSLKRLGVTEEIINEAGKETTGMAIQQGNNGSLAELFSGKYAVRIIVTWGIWFALNFGYFGFMLWLPSILVTMFKFTLVRSLTYTVIIAATGTLGRIIGVLLIDKIGRKKLIGFTFACAGLVGLIFGSVSDHKLLLIFAALFFFFADQGSVGVVTYVPELYPTHLRALGSSWAAAPGRIAAAVAPIVLGTLMAAQSYFTIWIIFAALYWLGALLVLTLGVETKGKVLEEV
ncbi:MFS transporter [Moorella naiadis]|uniref:MFS transporter n=1 Tax=Moorella naiadis (nom. illeg.) TaxID=3093670 RepID=UPI003D9C866E